VDEQRSVIGIVDAGAPQVADPSGVTERVRNQH
jgi:hypothetical protein